MEITCGKYRHFKGRPYYVYGVAKNENGESFVLYKQEYGNYNFWIRPLQMFFEKVEDEDNGKLVKRFELVKRKSDEESIGKLAEILKTKNIIMEHTETKERFRVVSLNTDSKGIIISPINNTVSYLTDSQLANRMGYELYLLNGEKIINKSPQTLFPTEKRLSIYISNKQDKEQDNKEIIKNQFQPCSIDIHISDEFFVPKFKVIDMTSSMLYSINAYKFWKKLKMKKIHGEKGVVLWPNRTVLTYTHENISLPSDCAGKIEIKSTYARLSLSVTASDFCNPGWKGHFPLTIKNNGNHIIVIHPREQMAQLSLVPTDAPIINEYSKKGVFMDDKGTPFKFWQSKTVNHIVSQSENDSVIKLFNAVLSKIKENSNDIENEKQRFENTFLNYYQRKMRRQKYKSIKDDKTKAKEIWKAYKKREQNMKYIFSLPTKIFAFLLSILVAAVPSIISWCEDGTLSKNTLILSIGCFTVAFIIQVVFHLKTPKYFCTFEKIEFIDVYED